MNAFETRTVKVYCGNFVGPPHWHGLEFYEPDECSSEVDLQLHPDDVAVAVYTCPGCGAVNAVRDHEQTDV